MYYVYILKLSNSNKKYYFGSTPNLKRRLLEHKTGKCKFTSKYLPIRLIYAEMYLAKDLALEREKKLKQFGLAYNGLLKRLKLK